MDTLITFFKEYYQITDEQIAFTTDQLNEDTVVYCGDLLLPNEGFMYYPNLKAILGNAYLNHLVTAVGIDQLEFILGNAFFCKLMSADGLENLKLIAEDASFDVLKNAKGFKELKAIGGIGYFGKLKTDKHIKDVDIYQPFIPRLRKKNN